MSSSSGRNDVSTQTHMHSLTASQSESQTHTHSHDSVDVTSGVPCQIMPHPLAQSASAPGSCKIFYDPLFSTLRLAALIEWETEIRQAGEAVLLYYLENDESNALSRDFHIVSRSTLKL